MRTEFLFVLYFFQRGAMLSGYIETFRYDAEGREFATERLSLAIQQ